MEGTKGTKREFLTTAIGEPFPMVTIFGYKNYLSLRFREEVREASEENFTTKYTNHTKKRMPLLTLFRGYNSIFFWLRLGGVNEFEELGYNGNVEHPTSNVKREESLSGFWKMILPKLEPHRAEEEKGKIICG